MSAPTENNYNNNSINPVTVPLVYPSTTPNPNTTYYVNQPSTLQPIVVQPGQQIVIQQPANDPLPPYSVDEKKGMDTSTNNNANNKIVLMVTSKVVPRHSFQTVCPHCKKNINTTVSYEENYITWILCIVLFVFTFIFFFIPFMINGLKDVVHHCPYCKKEVARNEK